MLRVNQKIEADVLVKKFEAQAEQTPGNIAVKAGAEIFTYKDLNLCANSIANLILSRGVGDIVALLFTQGTQMIAALLGALKAGKTYVPISADYPLQRISYMLQDSGAFLILTSSACEAKAGKLSGLTGIPEVNVDSIIQEKPRPAAAKPRRQVSGKDKNAYILYTSGSTGRPKGVLQTQCKVDYFIRNWIRIFSIIPEDNITLFSSFSHDASVMDIFSALHTGATLFPLDMKNREAAVDVSDFLEEEKISVWHSVPSLYSFFAASLAENSSFPRIRLILLGGEAVRQHEVDQLDKFFPNATLGNIYGQTETSFNSICLIRPQQRYSKSIIGKPLEDTEMVVLDDNGIPVQPLETGEIVVASPGLSPGYWNKPVETAGVFNCDEYMGRIYRTGDLGRLLLNGSIEFLGRKDYQVKLRGFRIEPGEIENRLLKHPGVKEAVVTLRLERTGDTYLCAYMVSDTEPDINKLRAFLSETLTDYMIPSRFMCLEKMPLTTTGKIDRKALPEPEDLDETDYTPPRNPVESKLVEIWCDVLGREKEQIGIDANFFRLGGHSLRATILVSKIHKEFDIKLPLKDVFNFPSVRELAEKVTGADADRYSTIEPVEKREYFPLSSAQTRLFVLQQMELASTGYNMPGIFSLQGTLDKDRLEDTFRQLIGRHESLRTSFLMIKEQPVQKVHRDVEFSIEYHEAKSEELSVSTIKNFIRTFELSQAPLIRVGLAVESSTSNILMVDTHHIIADGVSRGVLVKDFMDLYIGEAVRPLRVFYKDFSSWQDSENSNASIRKKEEFWIRQFSEEIPILNLPVDFVRPQVQSFAGNTETFVLTHGETAVLKELAEKGEATMFMVLLTVYNVFLSKICNHEEIIVGTPTAGRNHPDLEQVMGMFANTLVLKNEPAGGKMFSEFLWEVKERTLEALANQDYQYEELVEKLQVKRDPGRNPLFDTMFILQNMELPEINIPGLSLKPYDYERNITKFDLTLMCLEVEDTILCSFEYCTALFKKETIQRFIKYFKQAVLKTAQNPDKQISEIEILPGAEKRQLLIEFNNTAEEFRNGKTIFQLFEQQVDCIPDHPALVFNEKVVTFRRFDEQANRLANYLRKEQGVCNGHRTAVLMERSIELITALMGVLKAGSAYVPLDPDLPAERLRVVIEDASIGLMISQQEFARKLTPLRETCAGFHTLIYLDDPGNGVEKMSMERPGITGEENPAYVMYTSGSSGVPKGVLVEHRTIVNTLIWRKNFYDYSPGDVSLQIPPYFFDSSVTDIFTPLSGGARLVLVSEEKRIDLGALKEIIPTNKVSHFIAVPAFYNVLLEEISASLRGVKMICCAGEHFPDELIRKHFEKLPHVRIVNEYGPTENSVNTTAYDIKPDSPKALIGNPISNVKVYIVDRYLNLCPIAVSGEMCLSGSSLARGYLNNPELTNEKFTEKFMRRIYKTGDLARWLAHGNLEFLGRVDTQVKIRGIRVEIAEVENHLMKRDDIKEAVVLAREDSLKGGERYLCAYVVSANGKLDSAVDLEGYLADRLPQYMVPSYIMEINTIPFTSAGKIDRDALPVPEVVIEKFTAPRNEVEERMAEIWDGVLSAGKDAIGIDSDFFHLGGNSLQATTVASRLHKAFNVKVPLAEIFKTPTIRKLSQFICEAAKANYAAVENTEEKEYYPLTPAQKRLYVLQTMNKSGIVYNLPQLVELAGDSDKNRLQEIFRELVARHESLRTSFHMINDQQVQKVRDAVEFEIEYYEETANGGQGRGVKRIMRDFVRSFDLSRAPLLRVGLIKTGDGQCFLLVDTHHIISDAISNRELVGDYMKLYSGKTLPVLKLQYKDYAEWLNSEVIKNYIKQQERFWLNTFKGQLPVLNLPTDYNRPAVNRMEGDRILLEFDEQEAKALHLLALEHGATLFMVALTIYTVFLAKLSGQEDIIVGLPIAGRRHSDLEQIIGMFVATMPIRNFPVTEKTFAEFLREVRQRTLEALENQDYPFEDLLEKIHLTKEAGRNPLFDVFFQFNTFDFNTESVHSPLLPPIPAAEMEMAGAADEQYRYQPGISKFDLYLYGEERAGRLLFSLGYSTQLFRHETIEMFVENFKQVLKQVVENKDVKLKDIIISHGIYDKKIEIPETEFAF